MKVPSAATVTLTRHPATDCSIRTIEVNASWREPNVLKLNYVASGDISRLRIPETSLPRRTDGLWQHTCFEVFIGIKNISTYREFNFSPSGEWATYAFQRYRVGVLLDGDPRPPDIVVHHTLDRLELSVTFRIEQLSALQSDAILRLGLSAVIEASDGKLSYWALKHPADKPDFHHPDSFALELALPERSA
jgi:hypothetical protein